MKRLSEVLKRDKKIITLAVALVVLIVIAVVLFGNSSDILSSVNSETSESEMTESETKLKNILSEIDGVGESRVLINESDDAVIGVVIVCEGANNLMTRSDIINAVCVALNVKRSVIAIYCMK